MLGLLIGASLLTKAVSIPQEFIGIGQVASRLSLATGERHNISPDFKNEVIFIAGTDNSPDVIRERIAKVYTATWTHKGSTWTLARTDGQKEELIRNFGDELKKRIGNRLDSWLENGFQSLPIDKVLQLQIGDSLMLSNADYPFVERANLTTRSKSEKLALCVHRNVDPCWQFTLSEVATNGKLKRREGFEIRSAVDQVPENVKPELTGDVDEAFLAKLRTERDWSKTELLETYFGDIFRNLASKNSGLVAILPDVAMVRARYLLYLQKFPFPIKTWFGQISGEINWSFDASGTLYCKPSEALFSESGRADRLQIHRGLALTRRQGLIGTNRVAYEALFAPANFMYRDVVSFAIPDRDRIQGYGTGLADINWTPVLFSLSETERRRARDKSGVPIGSLNKNAQEAIRSAGLAACSGGRSSLLTSEGKNLESLRLYFAPVPNEQTTPTTLIHYSDKPTEIRIFETQLLGTWLAHDRSGKTTSLNYSVPLSTVKLQPIRNSYGYLYISKEPGAPGGRVLLSQSLGKKVDSIDKLPISDRKLIQKRYEFIHKILSRSDPKE